MRYLTRSIAAVTILLAAWSMSLVAKETRTLNGEYIWTQGSRGELEAIFTATGPGKWDVTFNFDFRDKPRVYTGTAEGSLTDGELKGTVKNEDKRRTFTFEGSFEGATFRGTHAETTPGRARDTGTLTLSEAPADDEPV